MQIIKSPTELNQQNKHTSQKGVVMDSLKAIYCFTIVSTLNEITA